MIEEDYKELAVIADRLAESVLMDWDKEEQVRLANEVAIKCHSIFNEKESREFVELVKRMRKAQKRQEYTDSTLDIEAMNECRKLTKQREAEVDELLMQMDV